MIRNLQRPNRLESTKAAVMQSIIQILKNQISNSVLFLALKSLLCLISSLSILFINDPLQPQISNQIFKIFLFSNLTQLLNINTHIILIIMATIILMSSVLIIINMYMNNDNTFIYVVKALGFVLPLCQILAVPIFYFLLQILAQNWTAFNAPTIILAISFAIGTMFVLGYLALFLFFNIRPLKFQNLQWNYSNYPQFLYYLFCLSRALLTFLQTHPLLILLFSLTIQSKLSQCSPYRTPLPSHILKSKHILSLIINLSLLIGYIFRIKQLSFVIFVVSTILYLMYAVIKYVRIRQDSQDLPMCKQQGLWRLYAWFMDWKVRGIGEDVNKKVGLHLLVCDSAQCIFKNPAQTKINVDLLQQRITKQLKKNRYNSADSQLLYQIWKIQLNKTISLCHNLRTFTLQHEFMVQYILGQQATTSQSLLMPTNDQVTNTSTSSQTNRSKYIFYGHLSKVITQFEKLSLILGKPLPQLNQVIDVVIGIDQETTNLTDYFQEMIKNKDTSYVCIELYIKFFDTFFHKNNLSNQIIDKLKILKICMDSDNIEENPLATVIIDSTTSAIYKTNSQFHKLVRLHRHQLKDKPLTTLLIPQICPKQAYQYCQQQQQHQPTLPIFLKIKQSQEYKTLSYNYKIKMIQNNNKNYYELSFIKNNQSTGASTSNVVEFVVDEELNIVASTSQMVALGYRDGNVLEKFQDLYRDKIRDILMQVSVDRVGRIQFEEFCLVSGMVAQKQWPYNFFENENGSIRDTQHVNRTVVQKRKHRYLTLTIIKRLLTSTRNNKRASQVRLSKLYDQKHQFAFLYRFNLDQQISLQGCHSSPLSQSTPDQQLIDQNISMHTLNQKLTQYIIQISGNTNINYSAGIKVYRLFHGDLYNIDLEDREKYNEEFNNVQFNFQASKACNIKPSPNFLVCMLVGLCAVIVGAGIFLNVQVYGTLLYVEQEQIKLMFLEEFSLNYNRMMASLRDQATGLYPSLGEDFKVNVLDSYAELQKLDSSTFLSQKIRTADYDGVTYQGSLSQLIQVSLTHVYEFLQLLYSPIIERIHNFSLSYLGPLLTQQKQDKKQGIKIQIQTLLTNTLICYITIISSSILYLISFLILSQDSKKIQNNFLEPILLTSQHEAKRISEQCEKFKMVISSLYKNYEIDLQSIGNNKVENQRKRARPKPTNFGILSMLVQIAVAGLTITLLIGIVTLEYSTIIKETSVVIKLFRQSQAVMESYSSLTWATNQFEHLNITNLPQIQQMSEHLHVIESNKDGYQFSQDLSQAVKQVFFEDSRNYLIEKGIIEQKYSGQFMRTFEIANPFKIGLGIYFHRIYYNLISDLDQTFGSNGIYSQPFKLTFQYFSKQIRQQTQHKLQNIRGTLLAIATVVNVLSLWLILIFVCSFFYFKNKIRTMSKGLMAFMGEDTPKKQNEGSAGKAEGENQGDWTNQHVQEDDFLITAQQGLDQVREQ